MKSTETGSKSWRGAGTALRALGYFGLVAAIGAVAIAFVLLNTTGETIRSSLEVTARAVALAEGTVDVAGESLEIAATSLDQIEATTEESATTFSNMATALDNAATIVGTDMPNTIAAVRRTTPVLINTADLLASTLGALSFLGVDVPAEGPADALRDVDNELAGLATGLAAEGTVIAGVAEDFRGYSDEAVVIASGISTASATLDRAVGIVEGYRTTSREAAVVIEKAVADFDGQLRLARVLIVLLGLIVIAGQAVPILLGRRLKELAPDLPSVADEISEMVRPESRKELVR